MNERFDPRGVTSMRNDFAVRLSSLTLAALVIALSLFACGSSARAKPIYLRGFSQAYPGLAQAASQTKCNVCHMGKDKKMRNIYGTAIAKNLGAMEFFSAMRYAEQAPSEIKGKTFGDLIKQGKLPTSKY